MTAELERWFDERGKGPGTRAIEKWVSAYVTARDTLKKRPRRK